MSVITENFFFSIFFSMVRWFQIRLPNGSESIRQICKSKCSD